MADNMQRSKVGGCGSLRTAVAISIALVLFNAIVPGTQAQIATMPSIGSLLQSNNSTSDDNNRPIYVEGYVTGTDSARSSDSYPLPGAVIYFIKNQQIVNQTKSNAVGYYSVVVTPGTYSVVTAASGFQTLMTEETFRGTRTLDRLMTKVPYNGLVPYAVNPVVETSPGREVRATICIENSQLSDQYLSFGLQAPEKDMKNWIGWTPEGDMLGVRSGDKREISFSFQYNGDTRGAFVWYLLVTGGPFFAKIPIVVIVKDMPYESLDLYTNYPTRTVKPGDVAHFVFNVNNGYSRDKPLLLDIEKPAGWGGTTGNGTLFYAAENQIATSDFWVYVPKSASPGFYNVNLTLKGKDVASNRLQLQIQVQGTPVYEALIKGYGVSDEGYPSINLSEGDAFDLPVRVFNDGDFPVDLAVTAQIGDNWAYYFNNAPWEKIKVEPGSASEFAIRARVPNGTAGNYTAKIYLEGGGQETMIMAQLNVQSRREPLLKADSLVGLALAGGTAGVIAASLLVTRKRRRY